MLSTHVNSMSSSARSAVLLPAPDSPVTITICIYSTASAVGSAGLGHRAIELVAKRARRVDALRLEQLVARGDLDQRREVAARAHRQRIFGTSTSSSALDAILEAEPVVLGVRVPLVELDDQLDLLRLAHRRDAEQVLDVDDAEPADLHVVTEDAGAAARSADGRGGGSRITSSATSRWPRTTRSSAVSLLPMPLLPTTARRCRARRATRRGARSTARAGRSSTRSPRR